MTNTHHPDGHFGIVVSKMSQLSALLQAIRKGADPACSSDGLEADKLGELVDVAESLLNDADVALADYHEAVSTPFERGLSPLPNLGQDVAVEAADRPIATSRYAKSSSDRSSGNCRAMTGDLAQQDETSSIGEFDADIQPGSSGHPDTTTQPSYVVGFPIGHGSDAAELLILCGLEPKSARSLTARAASQGSRGMYFATDPTREVLTALCKTSDGEWRAYEVDFAQGWSSFEEASAVATQLDQAASERHEGSKALDGVPLES